MTAFIGGGASVPVGTVAAQPANIPAGWLECDGAAISRTDYAGLFNEIGTDYGVGDGSTTFNLPDLRGEFVRGLDNGRGVDSGRVLGASQNYQMQGHRHLAKSASVTSSGGSSAARTAGAVYDYDVIGDPVDDGVNGVPSVGDETRPRNVAMYYCIKY